MIRIGIADDEDLVRDGLAALLSQQEGIIVVSTVSNVRVLVVSSFPEEEYARRAIRSGAAGYVRKTANPEELLGAIRTVAAGTRYVTEEVLGLMSESISGRDDEPHLKLSDREYQVFRLLGQGRSVTEISQSLRLSVSSISTYRNRVLEKLNLSSTSAIIHYAAQRNIR